MRAIELDVDGVDTVLPGDESDSVLVWRTGQRDLVTRSLKDFEDVFVKSSLASFLSLCCLLKNTQTSFQLSDDTLLQSSRGAVDFGCHLALCSVETHRKGCWVIHLQTRLLPRSDTHKVNAQGGTV